MLRASIEYSGKQADLGGISEGAKAGDAGIEHGERLTAFADAAVKGDPAELATARDALRNAAGSEVVVDAAGVVANFERMVRIADGTGRRSVDRPARGARPRRLPEPAAGALGSPRPAARAAAAQRPPRRPARRGSPEPTPKRGVKPRIACMAP
jgi:hypothetical protein